MEKPMNRIQYARIVLGLTQAEVAEKAGVGKNVIWELENGQRRDRHARTYHNVAAALGMPVEELLAEAGVKVA